MQAKLPERCCGTKSQWHYDCFHQPNEPAKSASNKHHHDSTACVAQSTRFLGTSSWFVFSLNTSEELILMWSIANFTSAQTFDPDWFFLNPTDPARTNWIKTTDPLKIILTEGKSARDDASGVTNAQIQRADLSFPKFRTNPCPAWLLAPITVTPLSNPPGAIGSSTQRVPTSSNAVQPLLRQPIGPSAKFVWSMIIRSLRRLPVSVE